MSLSVIIITKNEEDNIERCITSVRFADEILVIDNKSQDNTVAIAERLGAKTFVRTWPGYGPQKNFGAAQATGDWLLFLDADEEVTPALADEITALIANPIKDFYWLCITTVFLGKRLKHLHGHNPRLFKKSAGAWTSYHVNEQIQTNLGEVITLGDHLSATVKEHLLHNAHPTIASYLKGMVEYTTLDAQQMAKKNTHRSGRNIRPTWYLPYYLALRQFVKLYLYKRGILDGYAGLMWSTLSAYYEYVLGKKYLLIKSGQRQAHQPVIR